MVILWMVDQQNTYYNWQTSGPSFPWRQLLLGALAPITIFYILHRVGHPLTGALLAIGWSISLLVVKYWRSRSIELFPALAIPIILIELIGTLVTRNPDFYLASASIGSVLWGLLFLGSMLLPRPLIQIFAELLNPGLGSQEFFSQNTIPRQLYRSAWQILSLVVPEVNPEDIKQHKGIIANPNCSTIQMVVALNPLHKANPIKRIIVDTYQAVSGVGGSAALEELTTQSKQVMEGHNTIPHVFPHQIAFNILPEIDVFLDNGYTKEEWKMVEETRKIMHASEIAISATCARVPVYTGHSEAVHVEFSQSMSPEDARRILSHSPGIKLLDDPVISLYPQPWSAAGTDEVFVGRIRQEAENPRGLAMWIVADNVRKGAATNAVQIAQVLAKDYL